MKQCTYCCCNEYIKMRFSIILLILIKNTIHIYEYNLRNQLTGTHLLLKHLGKKYNYVTLSHRHLALDQSGNDPENDPRPSSVDAPSFLLAMTLFNMSATPVFKSALMQLVLED